MQAFYDAHTLQAAWNPTTAGRNQLGIYVERLESIAFCNSNRLLSDANFQVKRTHPCDRRALCAVLVRSDRHVRCLLNGPVATLERSHTYARDFLAVYHKGDASLDASLLGYLRSTQAKSAFGQL